MLFFFVVDSYSICSLTVQYFLVMNSPLCVSIEYIDCLKKIIPL